MAARRVEVWLPLNGQDVLAGHLFAETIRGRTTASFRFSPEYLTQPGAYSFDPAFQLNESTQVHPQGGLSGAFSDSQPDRWGRRLIQRNRSAQEKSAPTEVDYLLGVDDRLRMGAIRFREPGGDFLAPSEGSEVPPLINLPELALLAAMAESSDTAFERLAELTRVGSSLGGARPKANVIDGDGNIAIAKFTSVKDDDSTIAWEFVSLNMAEKCGIKVPKPQLLRVSGQPVLLMERFDRIGDQRIPYMSVMTLLQLTDGSDAHSCYVEIAEELPSRQDRHELFRRAALGLLIGNTDDHLRNHGLLRHEGTWRLSPAFDINPGTQKSDHATPIMFGEDDTVATLLNYADYFELTDSEARRSLRSVADAVLSWRAEARLAGISESECNRFKEIFESPLLTDAERMTRASG